MPAPPAPKRPNYFQSQFLIVRDFTDEQAYHEEMLRRHNRLMHDWGVVCDGLQVTRTGSDYSISAGSAIDSLGREIILESDRPLTSADVTAARAGSSDNVSITIAFNEINSDLKDDKYPPPGGSEHVTRVMQYPIIAATKSPANDGTVVLLTLIKPDGTVDNSGRKQATGFIRNDLYINGRVRVKGTADLLNLEGDTHGFVQFFPKGFAAGRKGWLGYGDAGESHLRIKQEGSGNVILTALQGYVGAVSSGGEGQGIQFGNGEIKFRGDEKQHFSIFANKVDKALTFTKSGSSTNMDTADAHLMTLADNGDVGIGTTGLPAARLHLESGALQIGTTATSVTTIDSRITHVFADEKSPRYTIDRDLLGLGQAGIGFNTRKVPSATLAANGSAVGMPADRTLAFSTSDGTSLVERMRIDSAGNVSITRDLSVTGALSVGNGIALNNKPLTLRADSNNLPDINHGLAYFGAGATTMGDFAMDGPVLYGSHGGALGTYGTKKAALRWTDTGNVGIGTTNPEDKLQIADSYNRIALGPAPNDSTNPTLYNADSGTAYLGFNAVRTYEGWRRSSDGNNNNGGSLIYNRIQGELCFVTLENNNKKFFSDSEIKDRKRMVIDANGSVSIARDLTVTGPVSATKLFSSDIRLRPGDENAGIGCFGAGSTSLGDFAIDGPVVYGKPGGALGSKSGTVTKVALRWNDSGNVGIGTTDPYAKLAVQLGTKISPDQARMMANQRKNSLLLDLNFSAWDAGKFFDLSGHGNGASRNGAVGFAQDPARGTCATFEGGYCTVGDLVADYSRGLTIEVWVRFRNFRDWARIIDFGNGPDADNIFLTTTGGNAGKPYFGVYQGGNSVTAVQPTFGLAPDTWTHLAVTMDTSGNTALYINGTLAASVPQQTLPLNTIRLNNFIGRSNWSADQAFDGWMSSLRIYNRALTPAEINADLKNDIPASGATPAVTADMIKKCADGKAIFVRTDAGDGRMSDGSIELRDSSLMQGLGLGYNTIYAAGDLLSQDLTIQSKGRGSLNLNPLNGSGNVGIGTNSPTQAKLVVNGAMPWTFKPYGFLSKIKSDVNYSPDDSKPAPAPYSIFAEARIAAGEFNAFSDERIKNIQGRSDGAMDLGTLLSIEVTDFRYKDVIGKGGAVHKKVIAQQVEKVFPQAVSKHTDVVPDIYRPAPLTRGWIELTTDLKKGERVKLITEKGEEVMHEVLEVTPEKFRVDSHFEGDQVFVFGREVNDFLTVDYDAISMLNVSATQQLKKEVETLRTEIAELKLINDGLKKLQVLDRKEAAAPSLVVAKNGSNGNGQH